MNALSRTLPFVRGTGVSSGLREIRSSALEQRTTWAAPDPTTLASDPWSAPTASAVIRDVHAPWPAPTASMRVDLAPPAAQLSGVVTNLIEPFHPVEMPDLAVAQHVAVFDPPVVGRPFPPPTIAESAESLAAAAATDRSGVGHRLAFGLAAAAGAVCAMVAAAISLF